MSYRPSNILIIDPTHKENFWHPSLPKLELEQIKSQLICNECGTSVSTLDELQLHLERKTAWSNKSLVGCRISCLVDHKEWHEGYVTQFHKSGKHFVEFRMVNEKRWLLMKKITFYIVQRPTIVQAPLQSPRDDCSMMSDGSGSESPREAASEASNDESEFKENGFEGQDGLAPIEKV